MKKVILLVAVYLCLLLTACGSKLEINDKIESLKNDISSPSEESSSGEDDVSKEDFLSDQKIENEDTSDTDSQTENPSANTPEPTPTDLDYANALKEVVGEDFLEDKGLLRSNNQEIFGNICAVFQVGKNTNEKFTTEYWFAVSSNGMVYSYDVGMDEWSEYESSTQEPVQIDRAEIDNCIYILNEYLREEFAVQYYDTPEYVKQAVFESGTSMPGTPYGIPDKLIGINEEIPEGYTYDPLGITYFPIYNFNNMDELLSYFQGYFTQSYMEEIELHLHDSLYEFDGTLYLLRGGKGYGVFALDFDSIDYSNMEIDNTVLVDRLLFGEKDVTLKITFEMDEGTLKISNVEDF